MPPAATVDKHLNDIIVSFINRPKQGQLAIHVSEIGIGAQLD